MLNSEMEVEECIQEKISPYSKSLLLYRKVFSCRHFQQSRLRRDLGLIVFALGKPKIA